jgi:hypothetical protein
MHFNAVSGQKMEVDQLQTGGYCQQGLDCPGAEQGLRRMGGIQPHAYSPRESEKAEVQEFCGERRWHP